MHVTETVSPVPESPSRFDSDADYLALLTRAVFEAGFSPHAVEARWPALREAFHEFEPIQVASMDEADVERLAADPRLVRNRRKIRATIRNARHFCEVAATHGTWRAWLQRMRGQAYEQRAETLCACLDLCGPATVYRFLLEAGEATPEDRPDPQG